MIPLTTDRSELERHHLLVVDDDEALLQVLEAYLVQHGYRVTTAESAAKAMAVLDGDRVDLIVIDVVMPDVDGMELLEWVRPRHPKLPAVILTGIGFDEMALREARDKGASGFLSKGLTLDQLLMEVHRLLNYG